PRPAPRGLGAVRSRRPGAGADRGDRRRLPPPARAALRGQLAGAAAGDDRAAGLGAGTAAGAAAVAAERDERRAAAARIAARLAARTRRVRGGAGARRRRDAPRPPLLRPGVGRG